MASRRKGVTHGSRTFYGGIDLLQSFVIDGRQEDPLDQLGGVRPGGLICGAPGVSIMARFGGRPGAQRRVGPVAI